MTDGDVANHDLRQLRHRRPPPDNSTDDSPAHTDDEHTLMQRGSDIDFLRRLARRTGRWCRVLCADKPGQRTGYFATPERRRRPGRSRSTLNDPAKAPGAGARLRLGRRPADRGRRAPGEPHRRRPGRRQRRHLRLRAGGARRARPRRRSPASDTTVDPHRRRRRRRAAAARPAGCCARPAGSPCEGTADLAVAQAGAAGRDRRRGRGRRHPAVRQVPGVERAPHASPRQAHSMAFVLVRNAIGPAPRSGERRAAAMNDQLLFELADRVAAPLLRQVPRHRHRRRLRHAAHQGHGARRARRDARPAGACRACPYAGAERRLLLRPRHRRRRVDRVRGRRRVATRSGPAASGARTSCRPTPPRRRAASSPRRRASCCSTTTPTTVTLADANNGTRDA